VVNITGEDSIMTSAPNIVEHFWYITFQGFEVTRMAQIPYRKLALRAPACHSHTSQKPRVPMIKMTDLYMHCKWENLQNRQFIKYFPTVSSPEKIVHSAFFSNSFVFVA